MSQSLVIGTRGSDLALWQAYFLQARLAEWGILSELHIIRTHGDRVQDRSFAQIPGTGFFTTELENALLAGDIDIAVHSHKDLPTQMRDELVIAGVSERADPADWLLIRPESVDRKEMMDLKIGCTVGTSSTRRESQLLAVRPDLKVKSIRGNVPTRLQHLVDGQFDAIVLAGAGLERLQLDLGSLRVVRLDPRDYPPAPAQGVLAFQCRRSDSETFAALSRLNNLSSSQIIKAERQVLANLRGGCQLPFGAYCEEQDGIMYLSISLGQDNGKFPRRLRLENPDSDVLVVEAWKKLHDPSPAKVFISRDLKEDSLLARACKDHNISLYAESLLTFEEVSVEWPLSVDWVMLSSRTAVQVLKNQAPDFAPSVRFGAIGEGTARALRRLGREVDFTFDPLNMSESAKLFLAEAKHSKVLFPSAETSMRTIQDLLGESVECIDLVVYQNRPREMFEIPVVDRAVLTSPMNARTYLERYPERSPDRFIAIGESTAKALKKLGCWNIYEARRPSDLALIEAIFSS